MWGGFGLSPDKTKLLLELGNSEVTETHILDLTKIAAPLELVISREERSLHDVLPVGDQYVITHNRAADGTHLPNNQVSIVDADKVTDRTAWRTVFEHSQTIKLDGVGVTRSICLLQFVRNDTRMWVVPLEGIGTENQAEIVEPAFPEELYQRHRLANTSIRRIFAWGTLPGLRRPRYWTTTRRQIHPSYVGQLKSPATIPNNIWLNVGGRLLNQPIVA